VACGGREIAIGTQHHTASSGFANGDETPSRATTNTVNSYYALKGKSYAWPLPGAYATLSTEALMQRFQEAWPSPPVDQELAIK
jgi:hypothetical protein